MTFIEKSLKPGQSFRMNPLFSNGFMIRAGQNKIAIPIEHRSYDGSYRIIANGVVNLNTVYEQNLHVRLQMNLSSSKILSLRAWIVENSRQRGRAGRSFSTAFRLWRRPFRNRRGPRKCFQV